MKIGSYCFAFWIICRGECVTRGSRGIALFNRAVRENRFQLEFFAITRKSVVG